VASVSSSSRAFVPSSTLVNISHPTETERENRSKDITRRTKELTNLRAMQLHQPAQSTLDTIKAKEDDLLRLDTSYKALCHDNHCCASMVVAFCQRHRKGCSRKDYMDLVLCGTARDPNGSPRSAEKCLKGQCDRCGFDNIIRKPLLETCSVLKNFTEFQYSEFSKMTRNDKPPDAVKKASTSSMAAHKALRTLLGIQASHASFPKYQKTCIIANRKAETSAHHALCIIEASQAKSVVAQKEASELATLHARSKALLHLARKCGQAMPRTAAQKRDGEDLLSVELKPLYPEGAQQRGVYLEKKSTGFVPFLTYLASTHYDYVMHDLAEMAGEAEKANGGKT
jgi:hypothetical protein